MGDPPPAPDAPRTLRVFVVENHADTLRYLCLYLEGLGHAVASARTMEEALAALPAADCDVLISDIGLPDGDGWELLRRARERLSRPVYAVAMSGFALDADQERSRAAGYRHHLRKPFDPTALDRLLREAAGGVVDRR